MLSLDPRQILHQKCHFCSPENANFVKILPQILNFANFVKNQYFRHDGQFSSFRQFFIKN